MRWVPPPDMLFAASEQVVPVVSLEMARVAASMVIVMVRGGEGLVPAALMSMTPGFNACIDASGKWVCGTYIPAALRGAPFALIPTAQRQLLLCVDQQFVVPEELSGGEPFFTPAGELSERTKAARDFLKDVEANRMGSARACAALARHQCLGPMALDDEAAETGQPRYLKVREAALGKLSAEALVELRDCGALALAYCQLISMQHLTALKELHARALANAAAAKAPPPAAPDGPVDLSILDKDGTMNFDAFR